MKDEGRTGPIKASGDDADANTCERGEGGGARDRVSGRPHHAGSLALAGGSAQAPERGQGAAHADTGIEGGARTATTQIAT